MGSSSIILSLFMYLLSIAVIHMKNVKWERAFIEERSAAAIIMFFLVLYLHVCLATVPLVHTD